MCIPALGAAGAGAAGAGAAGAAASAISPSLIAGIAMQGLGTLLQMRAARNAENARAAAVSANADRNRRLENEAAASIGVSRDQFDRTENFDPGMESAASEIASQYNANTTPMPVNVGNRAGVPQIVADAQAAELANAEAFNRQQNEALANLNSFGTYLKQTINPALSQSAADTALVGNFMRGNSNVLQAELEAANSKAYSPMAQLLTGGGRVLTGYGLYSPTGPASAAAPAVIETA